MPKQVSGNAMGLSWYAMGLSWYTMELSWCSPHNPHGPDQKKHQSESRPAPA